MINISSKSRKKSKIIEVKRKNRDKFIFKTIIDGLIAGLIAIGIFLGRPPNPKPAESYFYVLIIISVILILIAIFSFRFRERENAIGIFVVLAISIIEVSLIGIVFQEPIESIFITILIVFPSIIVIDKSLG